MSLKAIHPLEKQEGLSEFVMANLYEKIRHVQVRIWLDLTQTSVDTTKKSRDNN